MAARVIVERDVPCRTRDGVVLATDLYRPDDDERHPVLLQRTPYDKTAPLYTWPLADPLKLAAAGFVVAIQDVRGRFASEGRFYPYVYEGLDGSDAVAWAAEQPWSSGRVGLYGLSYMAGSSYMAAATRPPALGGLAVATSPNEALADHIVRGGAVHLGLVAAWSVASIGPNAVVRAHRDDPSMLAREFVGLIDDMDDLDEHMGRMPLMPFSPAGRFGFADWFTERFALLDRPEMWPPATPHSHAEIEVPALIIAGWNDVMLSGDLEHFRCMREQAATEEARRLTRIVIGPWAHGAFWPQVAERDFGVRASGLLVDAREDLTSLTRRWFGARLRGEQTGIDDEAPVKLFVMGRNRWRDEDAWPLARARTRRWHVHADGALSPRPPEGDAEPSVFWLDPDDPVPTHGGAVLMMPKYLRGPRDQRTIEERDDVLVFTSEPLQQDLEVTGPVRFSAYVAPETVDTDVVARLCDVDEAGRSISVCDGVQRLRFRNGLDRPEPATPGEVTAVQVDMWSTSYLFKAGHRLRLLVCASDFPRYDRCPGNGETSATAKQVLFQRNRLFHDPQRPSYLELPEVPS